MDVELKKIKKNVAGYFGMCLRKSWQHLNKKTKPQFF